MKKNRDIAALKFAEENIRKAISYGKYNINIYAFNITPFVCDELTKNGYKVQRHRVDLDRDSISDVFKISWNRGE